MNTNQALKQMAEHAFPCLKKKEEGLDCFYWLYGKCKAVERNQMEKEGRKLCTVEFTSRSARGLAPRTIGV